MGAACSSAEMHRPHGKHIQGSPRKLQPLANRGGSGAASPGAGSNGSARQPARMRTSKMVSMPPVSEGEEGHHIADRTCTEEVSLCDLQPSIDDGMSDFGDDWKSVGPSISGICTPAGRSECSQKRQLLLSRQLNALDSAMSSKDKTTVLLSELALADEPLPIDPWCRRCAPLRPFSVLPLKPEEVDPVNAARLRTLDISRRLEKKSRMKGLANNADHSEVGFNGSTTSDHHSEASKGGTVLRAIGMFKRMEQFTLRMIMPISKDTLFNFDTHVEEVHDLHLNNELAVSRFSAKPYDSGVPVLRRLTQYQIGKLELFMLMHIKSQYIRVSAASQALAPRDEKKHRLGMSFATIRALLKRDAKELKQEECNYLLGKLATLPFLKDIPADLLAKLFPMIKVQSYASGIEVFKEQALAEDIYILVQGEVELRSDAASLAHEQTKEAPSALLADDVFYPDALGRPFTFRPEAQRRWSRAAVTSVPQDEAATMVDLLFLPKKMLQAVSDHFRYEEFKERNDLVRDIFAPAMRLNPATCIKHAEIFELQSFKRSHVLLTVGTRPSKDSRLLLVLEGEVTMMLPSGKSHDAKGRKPSGAAKETAKRGKIVGDSALWGEPYPYTAVVASDIVQVLTCTVGQYLERLLKRSDFLPRRRVETTSAAPEKDGAQTPGAHAAAGGEDEVEQEPERAHDFAKALFNERKRVWKARDDLKSVKSSEWKRVGDKAEFSALLRPPGGPSQTRKYRNQQQLQQQRLSESLPTAGAEVAFWPAPPERAGETLRPGASWPPPISLERPTGSPCEDGAAGQLLVSSRSVAASVGQLSCLELERRVRQARASSDRAEAAHRSHVLRSYHEDPAFVEMVGPEVATYLGRP